MSDKMREAIIKILNSYKQEMEHYSYYGSNPGVSDEDFEAIANEIVAWNNCLTDLERQRIIDQQTQTKG